MSKSRKPLLFFLLAVVIIPQFLPLPKNSSAGTVTAYDIRKFYAVPADVDAILKASCYDCHSNNTVYPWYSKIQPVGWWLNDHITEGKKELNFSEFGTYRLKKQDKKLDEMADAIKDGYMPLSSYTLMHRAARLNKGQQLLLINWIAAVRDTIGERSR